MATHASSGLEQAAGHPWFHRVSRAGLAARGLLYLLIGWLALQIAFGGGGREADRKGALAAVAGQPGGPVVLWPFAAGLAALALWQCAEALYGRPVPDGDRPAKRLASAGRGAVYAAGCATSAAFLLGHRGASGDQESRTATARLLAEPGGRWAVLAIAAGFAAWGAAVIVHAVRRSFLDELETWQMGRAARRLVQPLAIAGGAARGLVGAAVGAFLAHAAVTARPEKAQGLDGALREFAGTPAGPWGLAAVALGVATFGLYSFCEARYRKVDATRPAPR